MNNLSVFWTVLIESADNQLKLTYQLSEGHCVPSVSHYRRVQFKYSQHNLQFRWLTITGIEAIYPRSITLFYNRL